jgi:Protein of unknown function (DUF3300)
MKSVVLAIAATLLLNEAGVLPPAGAAALQTSPAAVDELDRLLAPVALYPDQLLAQMLLCAANPAKVAAFAEWLASHQSATGTALQDAARASGFEPSFVALALFPEVVQTMAGRLDWTTRLGEVFAADRSAVFASIQRLRAKARDAGTLKTTPEQQVETKTTSSGQQVIVIEPANPQVVYVPQYDSQVVYAQPATSSTVVIQKEDDDDDAEAAVAGLVGFTAGVAIGAAMDNNYYYGPYGWHGGAYMYNDAWDDWYDDREDAREDWYDNREDAREDYQDRREDLADERGERAGTQQEQRTERQQNRQENRPETQAQRDQRRSDAQTARAQSSSTGAATYESRGKGQQGERASRERSGTRSDAFSGYSSGGSQRAASSRGQRSRGSARGGGRRR